MWVPLKEKEKKVKNQKGKKAYGVREDGRVGKSFFLFFFSLVSFSDLRKSDRRISLG